MTCSVGEWNLFSTCPTSFILFYFFFKPNWSRKQANRGINKLYGRTHLGQKKRTQNFFRSGKSQSTFSTGQDWRKRSSRLGKKSLIKIIDVTIVSMCVFSYTTG